MATDLLLTVPEAGKSLTEMTFCSFTEMNPTLTVPTWRWGGWLLSAGTPKESIWCTKCSLQVKIVSCEKNGLLQESSEFQRRLNLGERKEEKQPCSLKGEARQQENLFKCCESQDLGRMWSTVHKEIKYGREGIEGNCSAQSSVNSEASLLRQPLQLTITHRSVPHGGGRAIS